MHWFIYGGKRIRFTISIGAATFEKGMSAENWSILRMTDCIRQRKPEETKWFTHD
ncbi:MAG: hypothetical protein J5959_13735 [Butyrivibrio sp.]|nr:hypothetical protein [Butyrivibrio sp.]